MNYKDYLLTAHWQEVRRRKKSQCDYQCQRCGSSERLEVHHLTYDTLGQEALGDLELLCHDCHHAAHYPAHLEDQLPPHLLP